MSEATKMFYKEGIATFDIRDLHDKTMKIIVSENCGWLLVGAQDVDTGIIYVLQESRK